MPCRLNDRYGSIAQLVRAHALQAWGHRFESCYSHHTVFAPHGPVVQLVRTLACHARGRRFEPDPGRHLFSAFLDRKSGEKRKIMVDFPNNLW